MTEKSTLTPRQQEIYDFIEDKILNRGYGPTVREIGKAFGIRSPNGVMCHLKALERKGLIYGRLKFRVSWRMRTAKKARQHFSSRISCLISAALDNKQSRKCKHGLASSSVQ